MVERAVAGMARPAWVADGEVHDSDPTLRAGLEQLDFGYVLAVRRPLPVSVGTIVSRADGLVAALTARSWQLRPAGAGAIRPRWYGRASMNLPEPEPELTPVGGQRYLLIRRHRITGKLTFYRRWLPGR